MTAFWWWVVWLALMALGIGLTLRFRGRGALATLLALYAFLQASSHFYWNPGYKDGGNGVGLADWFVWLPSAAVMTALASVPALLARLKRRGS